MATISVTDTSDLIVTADLGKRLADVLGEATRLEVNAGGANARPRSATVMGLLEEARLARARGIKAAAQAGSVKTVLGRAKDWFLGNF